MPTTITNATELQAMANDLTEDYVLGNNIDASATSGWNAGAGFDPIGDIPQDLREVLMALVLQSMIYS